MTDSPLAPSASPPAGAAADPSPALRKAAAVIAAQRARLDVLEAEKAQARAPIAVIGLGCRYPGGLTDGDRLTAFFASGTRQVTDMPDNRLALLTAAGVDPTAWRGLTTTRGCYLADIDRFDAAFFGISPREAARMDPQQRLLLEVARETLDDAGLDPPPGPNRPCGVFIGAMAVDYATLAQHPARMDPHTGTGTSFSLLAGRLAHHFDLCGPAVALNTACSSSLVAVHQAMVALRRGNCAFALAGGVNLMVTPEVWRIETEAGMLAPDGACKPFAEAADGFGRGEGCGLLLLQPLDAALAQGNRIHALLLGGAVSHDGRGAAVMAPNPKAQEAVIRAALADAGCAPDAVGYVEAHGTGTRLGDPIEAEALAAAYATTGRDPAAPLRLGAAKAALGHTEGAAGITGLLRLIGALKTGHLPPQPDLGPLSSRIAWRDLRLALCDQPQPFAACGGAERPIGAVSSFGFSGTNVHLLATQAPPTGGPDARAGGAPLRPRRQWADTRHWVPPLALTDRPAPAASDTPPPPAADRGRLYRFVARSIDLSPQTAGEATDRSPVLLLGPAAGLAAAQPLRAGLTAAGVVVRDGDLATIDPDHPPRPAPDLDPGKESGTIPRVGGRVIVCLPPAADPAADPKTATPAPDEADQPPAEPLLRVLARVVRALVSATPPIRLFLLAPGALADVLDPRTAGPGTPTAAAVWAYFRSIYVEHPEAAGVLVDAAPGTDPALLAAAVGQGRERQLGLSGTRAAALRLVSLPAPPPRVAAPGETAVTPDLCAFAARPDRTYLVTGGYGSVGRALAGWLVARGARHLLLIGRSPPSTTACLGDTLATPNPAQAALWADLLALRGAGARLTLARADASDAAALAALIAAADPPLGGVIHAAGLSNQGLGGTDADLNALLAPKIGGARALAATTRDCDLDLLLFCSSAAVLGGSHLAPYAAANAWMDGLATRLRAAGHPALSIQFGGWAGSTMLRDPALRRYQHSAGFGSLAAERMTTLLNQALAHSRAAPGPAVIAALDLNPAAYRAVLSPSGLAPMLAEADTGTPAKTQTGTDAKPEPPAAADHPKTSADEGAIGARIRAAHPGRREALVLKEARALLARLLGHPPETRLPTETPMQDLGVNSLVALEFRDALAAGLGLALPSTMIYETPTLAAIAREVAQRLASDPPAPAPKAEAGSEAAPDPDPAEDPFAAELAATLARLADQTAGS